MCVLAGNYTTTFVDRLFTFGLAAINRDGDSCLALGHGRTGAY